MATYISNRDSGGLTDEKGHLKFLANSYTGNILDGMQVVESSPTGMSVRVSAGNIRIPYSNYAHMGWSEGYTGVSVATADPSNPRIDRVVAYVDRSMTFADTDTNNPNSLKFMAVTGTPNAVPSKSSDATVQTAVGASNPWCEIGLVRVNAAASSILNASITDTRTFISPTYQSDWRLLNSPVTSVTNNGQRNYDLTVSSDPTGFITPGMRIRTTRTTPVPVQSTTLNGTTQYLSKTSPTGMGFTDDFTVMIDIKTPSSIPSSTAYVVSMSSSTPNGWALRWETDGSVSLYGFAGSGNYSYVRTVQSLPLDRQIRIVACLDMSAFTATSTTSWIMIDDMSVPCYVSRAGSNPTALVSGGNLEIGSYGGGTFKFAGQVAQVGIFNAKITQATARTYTGQTLTGLETSLVSGYTLSNSLTDLNTTNANNLTATGSPVMTTADAPWGKQGDGTVSSVYDYAIVQKVTSSNINVQVPEGCTITTASGGLSSISYSSIKVPYNFPASKRKHSILYVNKYISGPINAVSYTNIAIIFTTPIGSWNIKTAAAYQAYYSGTASTTGFNVTLSTNTTTQTLYDTTKAYIGWGNYFDAVYAIEKPVELDVSTTYYVLLFNIGSVTGLNSNPDGAVSTITIENTYL